MSPSIEKDIREQYRAWKYKRLRQQTEMFWLLQLQLLEMNSKRLFAIWIILINSNLYRGNKHTYKFVNKAMDEKLTEEDRQCLATHLALQLAGIEE